MDSIKAQLDEALSLPSLRTEEQLRQAVEETLGRNRAPNGAHGIPSQGSAVEEVPAQEGLEQKSAEVWGFLERLRDVGLEGKTADAAVGSGRHDWKVGISGPRRLQGNCGNAD